MKHGWAIDLQVLAFATFPPPFLPPRFFSVVCFQAETVNVAKVADVTRYAVTAGALHIETAQILARNAEEMYRYWQQRAQHILRCGVTVVLTQRRAMGVPLPKHRQGVLAHWRAYGALPCYGPRKGVAGSTESCVRVLPSYHHRQVLFWSSG